MPSPFEPVTVGGLVLPHRIAMSPMTRNRAPGQVPTDLMALYYAQRAGAGLIITEGTQPSVVGQGYLNTPGIHSEEQIRGWRKVTDAVHGRGGRIFLQLMHSGRVGHASLLPDGMRHVAPSAVPANIQIFIGDGMGDASVPSELTEDGIAATIQDYVQAAANAIEAGFDGVELHGANGYLIHQFLSTNANLRTDHWGGSRRQPRPIRSRDRQGGRRPDRRISRRAARLSRRDQQRHPRGRPPRHLRRPRRRPQADRPGLPARLRRSIPRHHPAPAQGVRRHLHPQPVYARLLHRQRTTGTDRGRHRRRHHLRRPVPRQPRPAGPPGSATNPSTPPTRPPSTAATTTATPTTPHWRTDKGGPAGPSGGRVELPSAPPSTPGTTRGSPMPSAQPVARSFSSRESRPRSVSPSPH